MPHITINTWPGKTDAQKESLAKRIQQAVIDEFGSAPGHVSVTLREVPSENWPAFYRDEIYSFDSELLIAPADFSYPRFIVKPDRTEYITPEGDVLAVVLYPAAGPDTVEITHTEVDASLQGQGIAAKLTERAAAYLASQGKKVIPTCSYAQTWFHSSQTYKHLIAE